MSICNSSVFLSALAFYIVFNEKLHRKHMLGMVALVLAICLVSFSKSNTIMIEDP